MFIYNRATEMLSFGKMIEEALDGRVSCTSESMLRIPNVSNIVCPDENEKKDKLVNLVTCLINESEAKRATAKMTRTM